MALLGPLFDPARPFSNLFMPNNKKKSKGKRPMVVVRPPNAHNRPPRLRTLQMFNHTYAFRCTAGSISRVPITRGQLLALYTGSDSATVSRILFGSILIRKITMWGTSIPSTASIASDNSVTVIWEGVTGSQSEIYADSQSMAEVPYLTTRPPRRSSAAQWTTIEQVQPAPSGTEFGQGAEALFSIRAGSGCLLHLSVTVALMDTPFPLNFTTSGLTSGVPSYNSLDNIFLSGATHVWDPAGVRQLTT